MDAINTIGLPTDGKPYLDAMLMYCTFFLSRYPGNDIQALCGNVFDTPVAKTGILFVIMYFASKSWKVAIVMTIVFMAVQYMMGKCTLCGPYKERGTHSFVKTGSWVKTVETNSRPPPEPLDPSHQVNSDQLHVQGMY